MAARSSLVFLVCVAAILAAPSVVRAQGTGGISGTVSTYLDKALPGSTIEITGPASRFATSDEQGRFSIPNLPAGTYSVKVNRDGYLNTARSVVVEPGATRNLDVRLLPRPKIIQVSVRTGVGTETIQALGLDLDAATTTDLFNGSTVRTTFIDNTAAARQDLTFKARTNFWYIASVVDLPAVNERINVGLTGVLYVASQVIALTDLSGKITEISGNGLGGSLGAAVRYNLQPASLPSINQSLEFSFDGSLIRINDATRAPAQTSSGRVTSDGYDISGQRTFFDLNYVRTLSKFRYKAGVRRYSTSFDLDRSLDIDFSSVQAGVGLHAEGQTELSRSGFQLRAAVSYDASPRFAVTSSAAVGKKSWAIDAGVVWTFR